ncbi:MAG: aspartyl protease family protein [Burkholderiales bacterium]|nr:aspartyl protease family protein [Burkholderiales bacterium]
MHLIPHAAILAMTIASSVGVVAATMGEHELAQARSAAGGHYWRAVMTLSASGHIETAGLAGRWDRQEDVLTGRVREASDLGVSTSAEGDDGHGRWRQDPSGGVHPLNSAFAQQVTVTQRWLNRRGWLATNLAGAKIGAIANRTDEGRHYVVIQATPEAGQPVDLWFDRVSHQLARTVRAMPTSILTVRYGDYRKVAGVWLPFRIESQESGSPDMDRVTVDHWQLNRPIDDAHFRAPTPPADANLTGSTTVPIRMAGFIVLPAKINGQDFEFLLDTGGHNIITPAVAKALGVKPVGAGSSGGAGSEQIAEQYVRIDRLDIGAASMLNQHFYVLPLQYNTVEQGSRPPLAGILGLEVFERFATRIDYAQRSLTLTKLDQYHYSGRGVAVPIRFFDDMPLVDIRIDGHDGVAAVDTGNGGTMIVQGIWAQQQGIADQLKAGLKTVSYGTGGASTNWSSRVGKVEIGGLSVDHPIGRYAEDSAGAFSSRTEAANIGTDILSNFAVEFDYGRGVVWLEPQVGHVPEPYNRSGIRASKTEPDTFHVALVNPGSPGDLAGLKQGDTIISVDSVAASALSGRDLLDKFIQPVGTEVRLAVRRDNAVHDLRVRLAEMLP